MNPSRCLQTHKPPTVYMTKVSISFCHRLSRSGRPQAQNTTALLDTFWYKFTRVEHPLSERNRN